MKRTFFVAVLIFCGLAFAMNLYEVEGEIYLKQGNTPSKIGLNKDSSGLMLLEKDILEVTKGSKATIGDEDSYMEIYENSEILFREKDIKIIRGNFFVDSFNLPIVIQGKKFDFSNVRGLISDGVFEVIDGCFTLRSKKYKMGDFVDLFANDRKENAEREDVLAEIKIPPKREKEEKKDLLDIEKKNGINKKVLILAKAGEIEEAINILQDGLEKSSEETSFLNNLGVLYLKKGEENKAMRCYKKILLLKSDDPSAYYNIICIFSIKRDDVNTKLWYRQAKPYLTKEYLKAMETDPDLEFFRKIIND